MECLRVLSLIRISSVVWAKSQHTLAAIWLVSRLLYLTGKRVAFPEDLHKWWALYPFVFEWDS